MCMILIDLQMCIQKCKCSRNLYQSQCESDINGAKVFLECKKTWAKYPPGRKFSQAETSVRAKCPQGEMSVRAKCPQAETSTRPKCPQAKTSVRAKCPGRNVHCQKVSDRNVIQPKISMAHCAMATINHNISEPIIIASRIFAAVDYRVAIHFQQ